MSRFCVAVVAALAFAVAPADGAVAPQCGSAGVITAYCATWQTSSFGETTLAVDNNGTGEVTSFTFSMDFSSGNTLDSVSAQGASCSVHGRAEVSCTTGLQTGYSAGVSLKTANPLVPGLDGTLVLYAGTPPGVAQPPQNIRLQGTAVSTPKLSPAARTAIESDLHGADHALEFAIDRIRRAMRIVTVQERADDIARSRALGVLSVDDLEAAESRLKNVSSENKARTDVVRAIEFATKAEMEMDVTGDSEFSPAKVLPELQHALADAQAAAGVM